MSYELRTTPRFERLFKQLPREIQIQVTGPISRLSDDPYRGKLLHGRLKGKLSLAIGDYRVVYEVKTNTVYLLAVGHRKKIYQRLEH
ncbi:MAG: type II toxin-antitoxin system RelE family toxin [Candidatus Methanospirareceae archaeon]